MIRIMDSKCHCGKCGYEFDIQWEVDDMTNVHNHDEGMGQKTNI
ncbi:MAG: hypothetical protein PHW47_13380 [Lachnospira sp.]|nr:hypothetical protein [Lachnospira sp.]